jgi:cytochrome c peroxidase
MAFNHSLVFAILISTLSITACGGGGGSAGADDAVNTTAVSTIQMLGKKLFFDENLSSDSNQSCGSCHDPVAGFADPAVSVAAPVSAGSQLVPPTFGNRNAPTATYAALIPSFSPATMTTAGGTPSNFRGGQFLDGRASTLVEQAKAPFLNPLEMNNIDEADVVMKVQNSSYASDFTDVFGADAFDNPLQAYDNIAAAIAAFEATSEVNPFTSKFDAVMANSASFSTSELNGFNLFKGTRAKCANCHTVNTPGAGSLFTDFGYYNIGVPKNLDNPVYLATPGFIDVGLGGNTTLTAPEQVAEAGKFRTPTLRNIALTAPYMHNGVHATLSEVIQHYDIDVANEFVIPEVNANIANELGAGTLVGLGLQPGEYADLEAFLLTLTDGYM